jgi:hypothetical protein
LRIFRIFTGRSITRSPAGTIRCFRSGRFIHARGTDSAKRSLAFCPRSLPWVGEDVASLPLPTADKKGPSSKLDRPPSSSVSARSRAHETDTLRRPALHRLQADTAFRRTLPDTSALRHGHPTWWRLSIDRRYYPRSDPGKKWFGRVVTLSRNFCRAAG